MVEAVVPQPTSEQPAESKELTAQDISQKVNQLLATPEGHALLSQVMKKLEAEMPQLFAQQTEQQDRLNPALTHEKPVENETVEAKVQRMLKQIITLKHFPYQYNPEEYSVTDGKATAFTSPLVESLKNNLSVVQFMSMYRFDNYFARTFPNLVLKQGQGRYELSGSKYKLGEFYLCSFQKPNGEFHLTMNGRFNSDMNRDSVGDIEVDFANREAMQEFITVLQSSDAGKFMRELLGQVRGEKRKRYDDLLQNKTSHGSFPEKYDHALKLVKYVDLGTLT